MEYSQMTSSTTISTNATSSSNRLSTPSVLSGTKTSVINANINQTLSTHIMQPTNLISTPITSGSDFSSKPIKIIKNFELHKSGTACKTLRKSHMSFNGPNVASSCELQAFGLVQSSQTKLPIKLVKNRYLISTEPSHVSAAAASSTPISYRHLIDLTSSSLKCIDVFSGEMYACKIINEPLHKVQRAYFQLQQDKELCLSSIYGHMLIRDVHDIVPLSKQQTYIIIAPIWKNGATRDNTNIQLGIFENLHTYIRNQKCICEAEARTIFHQICQTVQVCHRNGIILRDLKLKRFYFIDEARTKLQYESLEGSMILDNPEDDTLFDKIGCPLYTAPELLCLHPTYHGKPADMWALGIILYTMLVGQYPFYERANSNLITIIRHGNVQIPTSMSKSARCLLLALLRKNYFDRLTAAHVFLTPWLREQRPFYTYLPASILVETYVDYETDIVKTEGTSETENSIFLNCVIQEESKAPISSTDFIQNRRPREQENISQNNVVHESNGFDDIN